MAIDLLEMAVGEGTAEERKAKTVRLAAEFVKIDKAALQNFLGVMGICGYELQLRSAKEDA